ncbi:DUF3781 domain-containing protein [Anoxybacterium hadale]|uniref:DUF3781 domain-containing protein n=1 Tax=Anoxybacterium hadale TaxID=3408580 RepID=A0ACD1AC04_9FIRM|nr:DUF3781 domain-containing protein [Clostridiales bacterium]
MKNYTGEELSEALRAINSIIHKCEKAQEKFPEGKPQHTLLRNRLKAMYLSKELITEELSKIGPSAVPQTSAQQTRAHAAAAQTSAKQTRAPQTSAEDNCSSALLLSNLDQLQTTDLGMERIRKNLNLDTDDVVLWCREKIKAPNAIVTRKGKNWYIAADGCEITVNARSFTIITAHKRTI